MSDIKEDARACISLKYKYPDMISCVQGQRPRLLDDDKLSKYLSFIATLTSSFEERVHELAGDYDA